MNLDKDQTQSDEVLHAFADARSWRRALEKRRQPLFTEDEMLAEAFGVPNYGKGLRS